LSGRLDAHRLHPHWHQRRPAPRIAEQHDFGWPQFHADLDRRGGMVDARQDRHAAGRHPRRRAGPSSPSARDGSGKSSIPSGVMRGLHGRQPGRLQGGLLTVREGFDVEALDQALATIGAS